MIRGIPPASSLPKSKPGHLHIIGGIIALGLGVQGLSVEECIRRFYIIIRKGFEHKSLTKARGVG